MWFKRLVCGQPAVLARASQYSDVLEKEAMVPLVQIRGHTRTRLPSGTTCATRKRVVYKVEPIELLLKFQFIILPRVVSVDNYFKLIHVISVST